MACNPTSIQSCRTLCTRPARPIKSQLVFCTADFKASDLSRTCTGRPSKTSGGPLLAVRLCRMLGAYRGLLPDFCMLCRGCHRLAKPSSVPHTLPRLLSRRSFRRLPCSASATVTEADVQRSPAVNSSNGSDPTNDRARSIGSAAPNRAQLSFQDAIIRLQQYWASVGCAVWLPHNTEVSPQDILLKKPPPPPPLFQRGQKGRSSLLDNWHGIIVVGRQKTTAIKCDAKTAACSQQAAFHDTQQHRYGSADHFTAVVIRKYKA